MLSSLNCVIHSTPQPDVSLSTRLALTSPSKRKVNKHVAFEEQGKQPPPPTFDEKITTS